MVYLCAARHINTHTLLVCHCRGFCFIVVVIVVVVVAVGETQSGTCVASADVVLLVAQPVRGAYGLLRGGSRPVGAKAAAAETKRGGGRKHL
jgi:hypothetical protein